MDRFSENYYHRICYLERKQVPPQTVMKKKMCNSLAQVYFKLMRPKLKVLAGLEPPMQGGGSDWFVPPKDLLLKRNKLKPVSRKCLAMLSALGADTIGIKVSERYQDQLYMEMCKALEESNAEWRRTVAQAEQVTWDTCCREFAEENTQEIRRAFNQFRDKYRSSIVQIETILFDASQAEIKRVDDLTNLKMSMKLQYLLKQQATMLYDRYDKKLMDTKECLKQRFISNVKNVRTDLNERIRAIQLDKHVAIEKLRHLLECQRLACQVYVALKERQECQTEINQIKKDHRKHAKYLTDKIAMKSFEIRLAMEKEFQRLQFECLWKRKVCHVVKKLQTFVHYCLKMLPEHAEFFLDMEKLMMLQLSEAIVEPEVESLFEQEVEQFVTPVPRPHPLIVYKDMHYKPHPDANLCPSRCWSSCSQIPVVVLNRRYIYTACDNMDHIQDKILDYISGKRGEPELFRDEAKYDGFVPVQYTREHGLAEIKLESSLMQVLQSELPNIRDLPTECCVCKLAHCFCSPMHASKITLTKPIAAPSPASSSVIKYPVKTRTMKPPDNLPQSELIGHINYLTKNRCPCANLYDHYPPYMRKRTTYNAPKMPPNYTPCSREQLGLLVNKYKERPPLPGPKAKTTIMKTVATQPSDTEFDELCYCFSDVEVNKIYEELVKALKGNKPQARAQFVTGPTSFDQTDTMSGFARKRAHSLRTLIDADLDVKDIFQSVDCDCDGWK